MRSSRLAPVLLGLLLARPVGAQDAPPAGPDPGPPLPPPVHVPSGGGAPPVGVPARPAALGPGAAQDLEASLARVLTPDQKAERAWLEDLGWRFVADVAVREITVTEGRPCARPTLAAAQAAGDLRVAFPPGVGDAEVARFAATLPVLGDSIATRCAWQHKMAPATLRATEKLSANARRGLYTFPKFLVIDSPWFSMEAPDDAWVKRKEEKLYVARGSPSAAISAFYDREVVAECYVGQTIATYAIQYEIFGPALFDEAYRPEEIAIGNVDPYNTTPVGKTMTSPQDYPWRGLLLRPQDTAQWGSVLARLGPLAFPGLTGIVRDVRDVDGANENFVFVDASPQAVRSLLEKDGFGWSHDAAVEAAQLYKAMRRPGVTGARLVEMERRLAEIDGDPIFTGIRIYIHPYGVQTLGEVVQEKRKRRGVAVTPMLYASARDDFFFQRYRQAFKARWARTAPAR